MSVDAPASAVTIAAGVPFFLAALRGGGVYPVPGRGWNFLTPKHTAIPVRWDRHETRCCCHKPRLPELFREARRRPLRRGPGPWRYPAWSETEFLRVLLPFPVVPHPRPTPLAGIGDMQSAG